MVESTVARKPEAVSPAAAIDAAVVSSVRRDLFRDRLKSLRTAWVFTMDHRRELVSSMFLSKESSQYGSVGYSRSVSKVSVHSSKSSRTHFTLKRFI